MTILSSWIIIQKECDSYQNSTVKKQQSSTIAKLIGTCHMENPPWKTHYCLHVHNFFLKEYKIMNKNTKWTFARKCRVEIQSCGSHIFNHDGCVNIIVFGPETFRWWEKGNSVSNLTVSPFRCDSTWPQPIVCDAAFLMYLGPHL